MAVSLHSAYTIKPCTVSCHFMQSHIPRVCACLVGTCHLHFWQNDRDLLQAIDQLGGSPSFDQGGGNPTLISYVRVGGSPTLLLISVRSPTFNSYVRMGGSPTFNHPTTFDHPTFDYVWKGALLLINYVYG